MKKTGQNRSGKKRQKAATNLPQYDAFCAGNCRQLPPFAAGSDAHSGSDEEPEAIYRQTSSLSTALAARKPSRCSATCVGTSSTPFNATKRLSTSAVHALKKGVENHRQDADSRRGKCHAQKFPFSRSLPGVLTMIFNALFQRVDG